MATTTTNYALKKYEGSDYFNPLTFENANADAIDQAMFANKQQGVGSATELTAGSVHAITRGNADSPIFAFTATSAYVAGDTFTVDGTPVTALTTSGETLESGAYIIGAQVLCYLRGTQLTVYVYKKPASTIDADHVDYDNSASGASATDAQEALDEAFGALNNIGMIYATDTELNTSGNSGTSTDIYELEDLPAGTYLFTVSGRIDQITTDPNKRVFIGLSIRNIAMSGGRADGNGTMSAQSGFSFSYIAKLTATTTVKANIYAESAWSGDVKGIFQAIRIK